MKKKIRRNQKKKMEMEEETRKGKEIQRRIKRKERK